VTWSRMSGRGHLWAAEIVEGRLPGPAPYVIVDAPQEPGAWVDWLTAGARRLAAAVRDGGLDLPVWTWRPREATAGFWLRKLLHDGLVHRFDVELADGRLGEVAGRTLGVSTTCRRRRRWSSSPSGNSSSSRRAR